MKVRVPVINTVGKSVSIEADAPSRAEMNAAIAAAISVQTATATPSSVVSVIWRFIREIPQNIVNFASLATGGLVTRQTGGGIVARSIAVADTSRLTVANASGNAGNPTLDMAEISAVSVWGRSANTTGVPAAIAAGANDTVVRRVSNTVDFGALTVGMAPNSLWTYAKVQDVSATARVLGRKTASAGVIEECTLSEILDFIGSAAQGDVLYRGASSWARLAAGTSGYVLSTNGAGANPSWIAQSGGGGSANITPDTHPSSPDSQDDEFESGSSIDTGKWTAFSLSTGTTAVAQGALAFKPALTASRNVGGYVQSVTGSWGYTCKLALANWGTGVGIGAGLIVATSSGASGKLILFGFGNVGSSPNFLVQRLTNSTTFSANQFLGGGLPSFSENSRLHTMEGYLRITYDGTNLKFWFSRTGVESSFLQVYTETSAAFLGTPGLIGIAADNESATVQLVCVSDWFRKTS